MTRITSIIFLVAVCLTTATVLANDANWQRSELLILQQSFLKMARKIRTEVERYNHHGVPLSRRNLVVFHISEANLDKDSMDISYNNLQVFVSSVLQHSDKSNNQAFYIFNDASGAMADSGRFIPADLDNVAHVVWPRKCNEKDTPLKTVLQLGASLYSNFSSIIVSSERSRGPMVGAKNGAWIDDFRFLLDQNNVGVVGSSFSCDPAPHVQPHMYAMRTELLTEASTKFDGPRKSLSANIISFFQDGVSAAATKLNYKLASILYYKRDGQHFFDNKCLVVENTPQQIRATGNPTTWCDLNPEDLVFVKWGGVPLRPPVTQMCIEQIDRVLSATAELAVADPKMQLHFPETHHRGVVYELRKQFSVELWRGRDVNRLIVSRNATQLLPSTTEKSIKYATSLANPRPFQVDKYGVRKQKVCFLVKVTPKQDSDPSVKFNSIFNLFHVEDLIHCKLYIFCFVYLYDQSVCKSYMCMR